MSFSVLVLCPTGHREKVKVSPTTPVLQILEEVCKRRDLTPVDEYEVRHGRTTVDLTLSVRFSGLPNNAKLEVVKSTHSRINATPTVALQLPTGDRVQAEFEVTKSLWDVLQHMESKLDGKTSLTRPGEGHPVCIYLNEEVVGECALQHSTLKKLGITNGKALIRLVHKKVDDGALREIQEKISKEQKRQAKLDARLAEKHKAEETESSQRLCEATESKESAVDSSNLAGNAKQQSQGITSIPEEPQPGCSVDPTVPSAQASDANLTHLQEQVVHTVARSIFPNFDSEEHTAALSAARQRSQQQVLHLSQLAAQPRLQDFKFPEATKGKNMYQNEFSDVSKQEYEPCDREMVLFSRKERRERAIAVDGGPEEIPDDFFEVRESDLRKMVEDLRKKVQQEEERALMTSSMRQAQLESKVLKYKRIILRINFPDEKVLQTVFNPRETVFALHKCVTSALQDDQLEFYLYISPPRKVLDDMAATLYEVGLAPMANVYFGSQEKRDEYLSSTILSDVSTELRASEVIDKYLPRENKPGTSGEVTPKPKEKSTGKTSASGGKMPSWFAKGKK